MKKREWAMDEVKKAALIIVLIFFSINGLIFISDFLGYVSLDSKAGTITEAVIENNAPAIDWIGVAGLAIFAPMGNQFYVRGPFTPAEIIKPMFAFQCMEPGIDQEVYATLIDPTLIDWNSIQSASPSAIDAYFGTPTFPDTSANNTFLQVLTLEIGPGNNIPTSAVYTHLFGLSDPTQKFGVGIYQDVYGNLIFGANVDNVNWSESFQNPDSIYQEPVNFQMILPVYNDSSISYYFTTDPTDDCPEGLGITGQTGYVYGNVSSSTGIRLQDAIVVIAGQNVLTSPIGFFNITVSVGEHVIAAFKEGYEVYVGNVTITTNNGTVHNIIMTPLSEYTGPGQTDFTNVDKGPSNKDETSKGIGPGIGPYLEEPKRVEGQDFIISIPQINRRIKIDNFLEETINLYSFKKETVNLDFSLEGDAADLIELDQESMLLSPNSNAQLNMRIFGRGPLGIYNGTLRISGSLNEEIPIKIELTDKDLLDVQTLFIDIEAIEKTVNPGDIFKYKTTLRNLLSDTSYPVYLLYTISDAKGEEVYMATTDNVFLKTSFSVIKNYKLLKTMPTGDYILTVQASYLELRSTASTIFKVKQPFYKYLVFGKIPLWWIILALLSILILSGAGYWYYKKVQEKKKYHLKVEYDELPKPGPRNVYVGKIAETDKKTYFNMENFKVHTIVAGSTGGGKSFSAQGIIEEMLNHNIAVIVFDPTAQWTGFLRKLTAKSILGLYSVFGMKLKEAKAFNGNIRQINNARELIDLKKYMKPGEIQVFACHKLDPKDMDIYVANAIREVFHANFDESRELRLMLVFDEVHRLLPKFGGSGEGFLQIERACREFRKWGIGVMLVSQVLSDFVGQIKANINTEIQMRTRDEGDLDRIATRYGKEVLQSLVKATVGTGMVENPSYNRGRPYFVSFKPIMHSVERLTDEEIEKYNRYNEEIDQIMFELDELEKNEGQDVFDLKLELKLALDKVKSGNFNMVDIYIEGIKPRVKKFWDSLGKKAPKLEKKMVDEETLKAELEKAKSERAKAVAKEEKEGSKDDESDKKEKKQDKTSMELRTEFKEALSFANGQQVTTLQELMDVIPTTDANILVKSVNDEKNDIEDWVRNKLGVPELADKLKGKMTRDEIKDVLGEEQKNPTKVKDKPAEPAKKEKVWPKLKLEYEKLPSSDAKIKFLSTKEKEHPSEANIKYALGIEYHKKKDYKNAEQMYLATLEIIPNNPKVNKHLQTVQKILSQLQKSQTLQIGKDEEKKEPGTNKTDKEAEKAVPPEKYFKLSDGKEIKSYKELKDAIKGMDEAMIKQYVTDSKNEFAAWVESALENKTLADKLRQAHSKSELEAALT